jgi:P27 family predicted phage terminase small subunit
MVGRKATPSHLVVLRGNPGKRAINQNEPTFSEDLPSAPDYLNARAKEIFALYATRLNEMGYASASHTEALALIAIRQDEVERYTKLIDEKGSSYKTKSATGQTIFKARPEVAMRSEALRHLDSMQGNFGLNPSAATKIVVPRRQKKNPFKAL